MKDETIEGYFHFDPEDPVYRVHFPGAPVVPGSFIAWAFMNILNRNGFIKETVELGPFRFKRFISPGTYRYAIVPGEKGMKCLLYDNRRTAAEGMILL
jgi:3-hydroxymyristoyl/3-hydroxydecanoyl-(acyl carrier protein) dehydratase